MTDAPQALTPEQQQQITAARVGAGKIRRALFVARFDAWCTAFFAVCGLMYAAVGAAFGHGLVPAVMGGALAVIAYNSFVGAGELKQYQVKGAKRLGWNQIAFCALICGYCVFTIVKGLLYTEDMLKPLMDYMSQMSELTNQSANTQDMVAMVKIVYCVIYGAVIVTSLLVQGLTAMYYFTRAGHVRAFVEKTPPWVVELLRTI